VGVEKVRTSKALAMSRAIGKEVFKTIVEMANEMDYAEKRDRDWGNARNTLEAILPQVQTTMNPRILRKIDIARKGEDYFTEPFTIRGVSYRFAIFMEYKRYRDNAGKVREGGIITISPQGKRYGDWRCLHRMMFSRREYYHRDEVPTKLNECKTGVIHHLLLI